MAIITEAQLLEGIIGGTGWILFVYYFKNYLDWSPQTEGFVAWVLVWYLRKIGMNLYSSFKNKNKSS